MKRAQRTAQQIVRFHSTKEQRHRLMKRRRTEWEVKKAAHQAGLNRAKIQRTSKRTFYDTIIIFTMALTPNM